MAAAFQVAPPSVVLKMELARPAYKVVGAVGSTASVSTAVPSGRPVLAATHPAPGVNLNTPLLDVKLA
jgi:hypothetical protein